MDDEAFEPQDTSLPTPSAQLVALQGQNNYRLGKALASKKHPADFALYKHKLEQYLESVREVERRIENEAKQIGAGQNISAAAAKQLNELNRRIGTAMGGDKKGLGSVQRIDHTEHARLMLDLIALAFWTDSTRVSTFMFGNAVSGKNFSFLDGVSGGHHSISHHKGDEKQLDQYQRINTWHTAQLAYLLQKMKS